MMTRLPQRSLMVLVASLVTLASFTTTSVQVVVVNAAVVSESDYYLYFDPEENDPVMEYVAAATNDDEDHYHHQTTPKSRGDFRASDKPKMVEFYNPYCGTCLAYKPTYLKLARDLEEEVDEDMEIYAVSCVAHQELCNDYKVDAIPLIGLFKLGESKPEQLRKLAVKEKHPAFILPYLFPERHDDNRDHHRHRHRPSNNNNHHHHQGEMSARAARGLLTGSEDEEEGEENNDNNPDEHEEANDDEKEKDEEGGEENEEEKNDEDGAENGNSNNKDDDGDNNNNNRNEEREEEEKVNGDGQGDEEEAAAMGDNNDDAAHEENEKNDDDEKEEKEERKVSLGRPRPVLAGAGDDDNNNNQDSDEPDGVAANGQPEGNDEPQDPDEDPEWVQEANRDWFDKNTGKRESSDDYDNLQGEGVRPRKGRARAGAGAIMKGGIMSDMDRYKDAMLEKQNNNVLNKLFLPFGAPKQKFDEKAMDAETGATHAMKAHRPGTPEFLERQSKIQAHVQKLLKKKGVRTAVPDTKAPMVFSGGAGGVSRIKLPANHKPVLPFKKELQKPKLLHKVVGKIPLAKRLVLLSHEEELILDASLSFTTALKLGVFTDNDPLDKHKKRALQSWFDLLRVALPPEWGLHELIMDLDNNLDNLSQSNAYLQKVLQQHELPRKEWSHSCTRNNNHHGFNCGFWKLLHIVTVGIAEHRGGLNLVEGGLVSKEARTFSPFEAAEAMKEYIKYFFPCTPCREHFTAQYDECSNRRCVRLTDAMEEASNADWLELSKWLWEVHNDVNVRLLKEKSAKRISIHDELAVLYPSLRDCVSCFKADGSYDEDTVFLYLEKEYWPGSSEIDPRNDSLFKFHNVEEEEFAYFWAFMLGAGWFMYLFVPRYCGVHARRAKKRAD